MHLTADHSNRLVTTNAWTSVEHDIVAGLVGQINSE